MNQVLHITSGDAAGAGLAAASLPGEVFVWHDILYDGPREPGWPSNETIEARAHFLESETGGGLVAASVRKTLAAQYHELESVGEYEKTVLWFDACLFDQAMLCHILACVHELGGVDAELLCIDAFDGVEPYDGLGQLDAAQLRSVYDRRVAVTPPMFEYAADVDAAFATRDVDRIAALAEADGVPLPWVPAAARRWLLEQPSPDTGLGRLQSLVMDALAAGHTTPGDILSCVAAADGHPRYWGDFTLWAKVNDLAGRVPPLVKIDGPAERLPQWGERVSPSGFEVTLARP
jgi:hypothetical protein